MEEPPGPPCITVKASGSGSGEWEGSFMTDNAIRRLSVSLGFSFLSKVAHWASISIAPDESSTLQRLKLNFDSEACVIPSKPRAPIIDMIKQTRRMLKILLPLPAARVPLISLGILKHKNMALLILSMVGKARTYHKLLGKTVF